MNLEQSDSGHFLGDSGNMGTIRVDVLDPGIKVHIKKRLVLPQDTCQLAVFMQLNNEFDMTFKTQVN